MLRLAQIAARNLTRNRRRTLLTLAALGVGVFAVVGVRGFLNGLQGTLIYGITEGTVGAVQVHRTGYLASMEAVPLKPNIAWNEELRNKLLSVDGVTGVAPRIGYGGMISIGEETLFTTITAVDPVAELQVCPRREGTLVSGKWMAPHSSQALLGMEIAQGLKAGVGTKGAILTADIDGVMNGVEIDVSGTVAALTQGEKRLVVMPLDKSQELLRMPGLVTEVAVQVHDLDDAAGVARRMQALLGPDYEVHTWSEIATFARDVQDTQNTALSIITYVFMFIMLMGIANTLLMSVMERVREIGTMMAVGTRRWQILVMFLFEALMLGALGAIIGAALGFLLVSLMGWQGIVLTTPGASLPQLLIPTIGVGFLFRMVLLASVGATVAAIYPATKASGMKPVEALGAV